MHTARRALRTTLTTRLTTGLAATLTTAVVASGAGPVASVAAAAPAPPGTVTTDRGTLGVLQVVSPTVILGAVDGVAAPGTPLGLQRPTWDVPDTLGALTVTESVQWLRDGAPVPSATGDSYLPGADDVGSNLQAVVTGRVLGLLPVQAVSGVVRVLAPGGGGGAGGGAQTPDPLTALQAPRLTGIPGVGSLLQVVDPVWSLPGVSTTYQWFADGLPIPGATGQTFVPTLAQGGTTLHARVTGLLAGLPLVDVLTGHLPIPLAPAQPLGATRQPELAGTPKVGRALTVSDPEWNTDGVDHAYQWLRDGAPIGGAERATYLLAPADLGHAISATVTGTKEGWTSASVESNAVTAAVGDAIVATVQPRVAGTAALDQTLTATPGTWGTGETPTFGYQWLRDGTPIGGATQAAYAVSAADLGRGLALRVTATRTAYAPGTFTTAALPVAKAGTTTSARAAKRTIRQGGAAVLTITVDATSATPDGTVTVTEGKRTLRTVSIPRGTRKVRVTGLTKGRHRLLVSYLGSDTTAASRASKVAVRVLGRRRK